VCFVNYGHPASELEARAANTIAAQYKVPLSTVSVSSSRAFSAGEVMGRNAFIIMAALMFGPRNPEFIAIGIHSGSPYYDCSVPFFERMSILVAEHTDGKCALLAPFLEWTKSEVFEYALSSGLDLSSTFSCEAGTSPTCGSCLSCLDRKVLHW
jgi:7-cyano-7-deazaguanine synthase